MAGLGPIIPIPDGRKGTNVPGWSTKSPAELESLMATHRGNRGLRLDNCAILDPDSQKAVLLCEQWDREGRLPPTPTFKTARGIIKRIFQKPDGLNVKLVIPDIKFELRAGARFYDVLPPSHVKDPEKGIDGAYSWLPGLDPQSLELAELPPEILEYFRTHAKAPDVDPCQRSNASPVGDEIPEHERNSTLASLAGSMRNRGMSWEEIQAALLEVNKNRCKPSLSENEVLSIARSVSRYAPGGNGGATRGAAPPQQDELQKTAWEFAARLFPRIPYPWKVLPDAIAASLQQLGRACATSDHALPGAAKSLTSSALGRTLVVSPKNGWDAPLIIWHMDIRESGDGKTPPVRLMARPIHEAQREEMERYSAELEAYDRLPKEERGENQPPRPPRGYFASDLTLEGLRDDLANSPHGGIVIIQDEVSAFISGQNQYKQRGTDREAWLAIWDGHPGRAVRTEKTTYLDGARVSIVGGIQPQVFRSCFARENGPYLSDGTLYRFLVTCEPSSYHDLTPESWDDAYRHNWEQMLAQALKWADEQIYAQGGKVKAPIQMILTADAQERFLEWRNYIYIYKYLLPAQLRGFLPKAVEYCLRLTGVIHCIQQFAAGEAPKRILTLADLERGIQAVQFYLGQVQDALRIIEQDGHVPIEISERSLLLARTLERLRPHVENGRLAVGFIQGHFNRDVPKTQVIQSPHAMGGLLRSVKLTILPGKYDANGHRAVKCLVWDKNTEVFIEQSLSCLQSLESQECQRFGDSDIEFSMSAMSESGTASMGENQTSQTLKNQCLHPEIHVSTGQPDIADNADVPLGEKNKIRCGYCQHFFLSPNAPGGRGSCHTVSWNEKTTQLSDDLHTCANFKRAEADDLRKVVI